MFLFRIRDASSNPLPWCSGHLFSSRLCPSMIARFLSQRPLESFLGPFRAAGFPGTLSCSLAPSISLSAPLKFFFSRTLDSRLLPPVADSRWALRISLGWALALFLFCSGFPLSFTSWGFSSADLIRLLHSSLRWRWRQARQPAHRACFHTVESFGPFNPCRSSGGLFVSKRCPRVARRLTEARFLATSVASSESVSNAWVVLFIVLQWVAVV